MKTIRRLFYADILSAVSFVAAAFLSLFFFIDFVDELADVGKRGYSALHAAMYSVFEIPEHLYELAPIAVLIGTIYALSRMAQASEFTILRTGGLGPGRALALLAGLGVVFAAITFAVGDYLAPWSAQQSSEWRSRFTGPSAVGAWLKDRQSGPDGERNVAIHIRSASDGNDLRGLRIFEFDSDGALQRRIAAESGRIDSRGQWQLREVSVTQWRRADAASPSTSAVTEQRLQTLDWSSRLSPSVVAAAVLPLSTMSTVELWHYISHLSANDQAVQRYEIQFWRRALYPLACLVMMALALPFAYLHARNGGISLKIFSGIMLGIGFVLLNNVAGHLGLLRDWTPWLTAAFPSAFFLLLSLAAFAWLVRYR